MKTLKLSLAVVLAISAIIQLGLGAYILLDMSGAVQSFGMPFTGDFVVRYIGTFFALTLVAIGVLSLLTARWVWRGELFGMYLSLYHGIMLSGIGLVGALLTGKFDSLAIDLLRGLLILALTLALQYFGKAEMTPFAGQ